MNYIWLCMLCALVFKMWCFEHSTCSWLIFCNQHWKEVCWAVSSHNGTLSESHNRPLWKAVLPKHWFILSIYHLDFHYFTLLYCISCLGTLPPKNTWFLTKWLGRAKLDGVSWRGTFSKFTSSKFAPSNDAPVRSDLEKSEPPRSAWRSCRCKKNFIFVLFSKKDFFTKLVDENRKMIWINFKEIKWCIYKKMTYLDLPSV